MRKLACAFLFFAAPFASAAIINVEFKFAAFTGDPVNEQEVTTVAGTAQLFINNVPVTEQEIRADKLPVLFETREVSPAISSMMSAAGHVVRKGKNKFRLEFTPNDLATPYRAQLRWAAVTDRPADEFASHGKAKNQTDEGIDDRKEVKGKIVFERDFTADFALDLPWHHYPPVAALTPDDKSKIAALLQARADWFKPDFAALYHALEQDESLKLEDVRRAQCLEKAYQAGVRIVAPPMNELDFTITGQPEVIVRRTQGALFALDDKTFAPLADEDVKMCASTVLSTVYPGRLAAAKKPDGSWEIVD